MIFHNNENMSGKLSPEMAPPAKKDATAAGTCSKGTAASQQPLFRSKDILCGRGGLANKHGANRIYRRLVNANKSRYRDLNTKDRSLLIKSILESLERHGMRFVRQDKTEKDTSWTPISRDEAWIKTSKALQEPEDKPSAATVPRRRRRSSSNSLGSATSAVRGMNLSGPRQNNNMSSSELSMDLDEDEEVEVVNHDQEASGDRADDDDSEKATDSDDSAASPLEPLAVSFVNPPAAVKPKPSRGAEAGYMQPSFATPPDPTVPLPLRPNTCQRAASFAAPSLSAFDAAQSLTLLNSRGTPPPVEQLHDYQSAPAPAPLVARGDSLLDDDPPSAHYDLTGGDGFAPQQSCEQPGSPSAAPQEQEGDEPAPPPPCFTRMTSLGPFSVGPMPPPLSQVQKAPVVVANNSHDGLYPIATRNGGNKGGVKRSPEGLLRWR